MTGATHAKSRFRAADWIIVAIVVVASALLLSLCNRAEEGRRQQRPSMGQDDADVEGPLLRGDPADLSSAAGDPGADADAGPAIEDALTLVMGGTVFDEYAGPVARGAVSITASTPDDHVESRVIAKLGLRSDGTFGGTVSVSDDVSSLRVLFAESGELVSLPTYLASPFERSYDLSLQAFRTARLDVTVLTSEGSPVSGAVITSYPPYALPAPVTTDEAGKAVAFPCGDPITVLLAHGPDGARAQSRPLGLQPGDSRSVTIRLPSSLLQAVPVRCVASATPGLDGVSARLRIGGGGASWKTIIIGGPSVIVQLQESVRLRARLDVPNLGCIFYRWPNLAAALGGQGEIVLDIGQRGAVCLVLLGPGAVPCPHAWVELRESGEGIRTQRALTDIHGMARFEGIEFGHYSISMGTTTLGEFNLHASRLERTCHVPVVSMLAGTYAGPSSLSNGQLKLNVTTDAGDTWSYGLSSLLEATEWRISVPLAVGSSVELAVSAEGASSLWSQRVATGEDSTRISVEESVIKLRVVAGARVHVLGWIQLRYGGDPRTRRVAIDPRTSAVHLPMLETGRYDVLYFTEMWPTKEPTPTHVLEVREGETEYVIDVGVD